MNPSYDNGFGSFGSGGTSPGGGVGGMNSGVGSSAGGRAVGGVSGGGSMASGSPMLSGSPMANIPTSSGTGDIVLASAPEKKSRKGLVVGIILVVLVLVGVGVGVWALVGGGQNKNGMNGGETSLKSVFNGYANYVLFGEESDKDLTEDNILGATAYFEDADFSEDELAIYINNVSGLFGKLKKEYSDNGYSDFYLSDLLNYFQYFAAIQPLTVKKISNTYRDEGYGDAESLIISRYAVDGEITNDFSNYLNAMRVSGLTALEIINRADAQGCVLDDTLENECYTMSENEKQILMDESKNIVESSRAVRLDAFLALSNMRDEIYYGIEKNSNVLQNIDETQNEDGDIE